MKSKSIQSIPTADASVISGNCVAGLNRPRESNRDRRLIAKVQREYEASLPIIFLEPDSVIMDKLADALDAADIVFRITKTIDPIIFSVKGECDAATLAGICAPFGRITSEPRGVWHWFIEWCPVCKFNASQSPVRDVEGEDCNLFDKVDTYRTTQAGDHPYKCACGAKLQARYALSEK